MHGGPTPLIDVRSLDRCFGPRAALSAVDLVVKPGEIHGLIGPRAAGKSTLLRVLHGALEATAGRVWVPGTTALVGADGDSLSPIEAGLSAGARRRIALARALADRPDVLLVDEPIDGFDHQTAATTRALVARHAATGGAVVMATRRLDDLKQLASSVTLLAAGRVRYSGSVEVLALRALAGSAETLADTLRDAA